MDYKVSDQEEQRLRTDVIEAPLATFFVRKNAPLQITD